MKTIDRDTFSVTLARQMLAMLDRDTGSVDDGDRLPRGWHSAMFAPAINGNLTALMLTELYRAQSGAEPRTFVTRNLRPLLCGRENRLRSEPGEDGWRLWAEDDQGRPALQALFT